MSCFSSEPSGRIKCSSYQPLRSDANTIHSPSGDHAGKRSAISGGALIVRTAPVSMFATQIWLSRRSLRTQKT